MSAPLNSNDWSLSFGDGSRLRFSRIVGILTAVFRDCGGWVYNASLSLFRLFMADGAVVLHYDAIGHHYVTTLPTGADFTVTLNGTTILVTSTGQVNITASKGINLIAQDGDIDLTAQSGNINATASSAMALDAQGGNLSLTASANVPIKTQTMNDSIDNLQSIYNQHNHGGVTAGSSNTQSPNQQWT